MLLLLNTLVCSATRLPTALRFIRCRQFLRRKSC